MKKKPTYHLLIERIDPPNGSRRVWVYSKREDLESGMTPEKLIRHMLNAAAEEFPEPIVAALHD